MAKPVGPLLSVEARGQFGKVLNFSKRKSGQMVRQYHSPHKPRTADQLIQREKIALLTAQWQAMSTSAKAVYNTQAKNSGLPITGFNLFIRAGCADFKTIHGLLCFFPFEEKSGATIIDASGQNKNGTMYGDSYRVPGKIGQGVRVDGNGDYMRVNNINVALNGTLSFVMWFRLWQTVNEVGHHIQFYNNLYWHSSVDALYIPGTTDRFYFVPKKNIWYHMVHTYNGNTYTSKLYINGVKYDCYISTGAHNIGAITIAYFLDLPGYTRFATADVDDVKMYNRELSQAEVIAQYKLFDDQQSN